MDEARDRNFILPDCPEHEYCRRGAWLLAAVFFGAILFGAVLAPVIFNLFKGWAESDPNEINAFFARKPFPRYVDRVRWIATLALLPWFLKAVGLFSWQRLGLSTDARAVRQCAVWIFAGLALPAAVSVLQLATLADAIVWKATSGVFLRALLVGLLAAGIVGVVEETLMRGVLLRVLYTALRPSRAVLVASLLFSALHFKKIPESVWARGDPVELLTGLEVGFWTVLGLYEAFDPVRFLNLFLSGLILSLLFLRTRSLWPCIGLHAGWVLYRAVYSKCVHIPIWDSHVFLGSESIIDGLAATALLTAMAGALAFAPGGVAKRGASTTEM